VILHVIARDKYSTILVCFVVKMQHMMVKNVVATPGTKYITPRLAHARVQDILTRLETAFFADQLLI
jgi:hypothetical protein